MCLCAGWPRNPFGRFTLHVSVDLGSRNRNKTAPSEARRGFLAFAAQKPGAESRPCRRSAPPVMSIEFVALIARDLPARSQAWR